MVKLETASIRLYNDRTHSQKFVLDMMVNILGHDPDQALQCILLIECRGSYVVRENVEMVKAMDLAGVMRGLGFQVELESN